MSDAADLGRRLRSGDPNVSGIALGELIALGQAATPALAEAAADSSAGSYPGRGFPRATHGGLLLW